jgi:uncharacterized protein YceK
LDIKLRRTKATHSRSPGGLGGFVYTAARALTGVTLALGAVVVLLLSGCGSGTNESTAASGESKESTAANAEGGNARMRRWCLKDRENSTFPPPIQNICETVGVTESSPPASSPEAIEAVKSGEEEESQGQQTAAELPINEKQRRAAALLDLTRGNQSEAERELEEGCPKADREGLSEAWLALQRLDQGGPEPSLPELEESLDEICPL